MILELLKAGADAKYKDGYGKTAFFYAQPRQDLEGTDAPKQLEEASEQRKSASGAIIGFPGAASIVEGRARVMASMEDSDRLQVILTWLPLTMMFPLLPRK
jgi:hypothetical protein